jgi:hypothetical protein
LTLKLNASVDAMVPVVAEERPKIDGRMSLMQARAAAKRQAKWDKDHAPLPQKSSLKGEVVQADRKGRVRR